MFVQENSQKRWPLFQKIALCSNYITTGSFSLSLSTGEVGVSREYKCGSAIHTIGFVKVIQDRSLSVMSETY
jgi:hypothetical protein